MSSIVFADNFLAASILTLLLPVCLLIALAVWYVLSLDRIPGAEPGPVANPDPVPDFSAGAPGADPGAGGGQATSGPER